MAGGTSSGTGSFTLSLISDTTCEELGTLSIRRPRPWDIYIDLGGRGPGAVTSYGRFRRPRPWGRDQLWQI